MRLIDTPVVADRTVRELVLIAGGAAAVGFAATAPHEIIWVHLIAYAAITVLFAARWFAARVAMVGFCLSAMIWWLAINRWGVNWAPGSELALDASVLALLGGIVVLSSRDLAERFDLGAERGWRANPWREVPRTHWFAACWCGYAVGTLGNLLFQAYRVVPSAEAAFWPVPLIAGCALALFLLFSGKPFGFVVAAATAALVLVYTLPAVGAAEAYLADGWAGQVPESTVYRAAPWAALPTAITAGITSVICGAYAVFCWRKTG